MTTLRFLREILLGKTLARILFNKKLEELNVNLSGNVFDFGSGAGTGSYFRFMSKQHDIKINTVDIDPNSKATIKADLNKAFPKKVQNADAILAFNVIQYIESPYDFLAKCRRILKPGGKIYCNFYFMSPIQDHPADLYRFSDRAIELLIRENNFLSVQIYPYGGRFSNCISLFDNNIIKLIRLFVYPIILVLDFFDKESRTCPMGYICVLQGKK